jgi:3-oxoacyl-[acyl-carrier protein] reductase
MDLEGRVALVTGGATGIGRSVALALAAAGARAVAINYRQSAAEAAQTMRDVEQAGAASMALQTDVKLDSQVRQLVNSVASLFGALDILVACAGTTEYIDIRDLDAVTDQTWNEIFDVNLRGAFYCARAAAPHLKAAGGAIVLVSSLAAHRGGGSSVPYSLSKAAVSELARVLAVSLAPQVRVNAVSPGMVETRWARVRTGDEAAEAGQARTRAATPLGRNGQPEDVATAILGLIRSDFVTGQDLIVDGGRGMALP